MIKVYVIAPDRASGYFFCDVMKNRGIEAEFNFHKVRPRVIENKLTTANDVTEDMNKIFGEFRDKTKSVVIACNTLQLWLKKVDQKYMTNVKVYTTFEACGWKFEKWKQKPLWLGTTPLVKATESFPTFISLGRPDLQEKLQELIWRIKMLEGDEFGTAPKVVKDDYMNRPLQKSKINVLRTLLLEGLKELGVRTVIMGCTEIPLVFRKNKELGITFVDPANVLADYIKSQSVVVVFAGGTISSMADKEGMRLGGKVFDLLERLGEKLPGSYKNINVTKSRVVFSGLSENMTNKEREAVLREVKGHVDDGVSRIVVTHGTDSMEQTAVYLEKHLGKNLRKRNVFVVLTGSNDYAGKIGTDSWDNMSLALGNGSYREGGVYIAFGGKFVRASEAVKEFFNGKRMRYVSVSSKQYSSSLKRYISEVVRLNSLLEKNRITSKSEELPFLSYEVNVCRANHDHFKELVRKHKPKVVFFELYHSGTANTEDKKSSVSDLVWWLTKRGIVCFGGTENGEPTDLHLYSSSRDLLNSGMVPLYDMLLPVAICKFQVLFSNKTKVSRREIIEVMLKNKVGEIDEGLVNAEDIKKLTSNRYSSSFMKRVIG